jgi:hypothetical protein
MLFLNYEFTATVSDYYNTIFSNPFRIIELYNNVTDYRRQLTAVQRQ